MSALRGAVFRELVEALRVAHPTPDWDIDLRAIEERESKLNTFVVPGAAVPHGYYPGIDGIYGALGS
jgi:mannitol/fructose-specific phosphotransferase system IIA component (Ntr-type)